MADISKLKNFMDAYGVAVRAGVITPCRDDESYVRDLFGLPVMSSEVSAEWDRVKGVRIPLTIVQATNLQEDPNADTAVPVKPNDKVRK